LKILIFSSRFFVIFLKINVLIVRICCNYKIRKKIIYEICIAKIIFWGIAFIKIDVYYRIFNIQAIIINLKIGSILKIRTNNSNINPWFEILNVFLIVAKIILGAKFDWNSWRWWLRKPLTIVLILLLKINVNILKYFWNIR
jgi:hypothetical protein